MFGKKKADIAGQKGERKTIDKKIVAFTMFTIGNIFALSAASFAWFYTATHNSELSTVSGDMNVKIDSITAYKYVYPYYNNSTEFVDYGIDGQNGIIKGYVIEDSEIPKITNPSLTTTITLGALGDVALNNYVSTATGTSSKIHYETTHNERMKYFLVGDSRFTGLSTDPWSSLTGAAFNATSAITTSTSAIASNVVVSQGAEFILFDATTVNTAANACAYYSYSSVSTSDSKTPCFKIDDGKIVCLYSGVYTFTFREETALEVTTRYLDITLARTDDAIIGNNVLDPTISYLNYYALPGEERASTSLSSYLDAELPKEIHHQNTMVILDVKLIYQNKNPIRAGLKVIRELEGSSVFSLANGFDNATDFVDGHPKDSSLRASDFYSFYAVLADEAHKYATGDDIWNGVHLEGKARVEDLQVKGKDFEKFTNAPSSFTSFGCSLSFNGIADDRIAASTTNNVYHCYVGIEYDYEHCKFFTNEKRVGKKYYLKRDFGLYFTGTQITEE